MPVGFDDGTTLRLITKWNKAGTIWCHHLSTKEDAVNRYCFIPASCERFSIRYRIMPVPGQWCRFQIILASCERGLSLPRNKRGCWLTLIFGIHQCQDQSFSRSRALYWALQQHFHGIQNENPLPLLSPDIGHDNVYSM